MRIFLWVGTFLVVLGGAVWYVWQTQFTLPALELPNVKMPSPNAYDSYTKAGDILNRSGFNEKWGKLRTEAGFGVEQAQRDKIARESAAALRLVRTALRQEHREPLITSFGTLPDFAHYLLIAKLLQVNALAKGGRGDWAGAMESALDCVQMGTHMPSGGVLITKLTGIACEAIGRGTACRVIPHLGSTEALTAAQRLERFLSVRVPASEAFRGEKLAGQGELLKTLLAANWRARLDRIPGGEPQKTESGMLASWLSLRNRRGLFDQYSAYLDSLIFAANEPYASRPSISQFPADSPVSLILPDLYTVTVTDTAARAMDELLMLGLTLQAHRVAHGAYPASLSELTPRYLEQIPSDPFSLQKPYIYRRAGHGYILYSIGPDGKDDGGVPIFNPGAKGSKQLRELRYGVNDRDKGDIVMGFEG